MPNRHKHADVIIAWANGETIEYRFILPTLYGTKWSEWKPLPKEDTIHWHKDNEYRVKPKKKTPSQVYFNNIAQTSVHDSLKAVIEAYKRGELDYE